MIATLHAAGSILSTSIRDWTGPASSVLARFLQDARLEGAAPLPAPERDQWLTFAEYLREKPQLDWSHKRGPISAGHLGVK